MHFKLLDVDELYKNHSKILSLVVFISSQFIISYHSVFPTTSVWRKNHPQGT